MEPEVYFINSANLSQFFQRLRQGKVYGTVRREENSTYEAIPENNEADIVLAIHPPVESIKGFLFPAREKVAVYPGEDGELRQDENQPTDEPQTVIGARACDLCALNVLDEIFLKQQVKDPFYEKRRKNTLLITTDCTEPKPTCFCTLVGGKPFPEKDYDINLSIIEGGYIIAVGSERGQTLIKGVSDLLAEPTSEQLDRRERQRQAVLAELEKINKSFETKTSPMQLACEQPKEKWEQLTGTCVECGACSFICPTCHCFFLFDQPNKNDHDQNERRKSWDSCILGNFAKMAGVGGMKPTPRPELRSRYENRIRHKFEWMPENIQLLGCVGCGRCTEACLDGGDIRKIFKEFGS